MWQLPKNLFVQNSTIAFAKGDTKSILQSVTDDIRWNIIGKLSIQGKDEFVDALERMKNEKAVELTIDHVSTHGRAGAVSGTTKLKHGKIRSFCDVYKFSDTKGTRVREITSYRIEIK